jgi:hypothetical protein
MRCPVCRAEVEQGPQCRRCRADLSLLFELEEQRRRALTAAYQCLQQGRYPYALALAEGAETLRRDEETRRLRALIYFLQRNFAQAWAVYNSRP